jgi:hypothetical protein
LHRNRPRSSRIPLCLRAAALTGIAALTLAPSTAVFAAPKAVLVEPLEQKLGEVEPDVVQKLVWTLRNDGDQPLLVIGTAPTCYCTIAKVESRQIAPGASTKINVTIDPSDFVGTIHKGFELETNDPVNGKMLADVELTVRPGIAVVPPELDLGAVPAAGSKEFSVDLKSAKSRPFKVTGVTSGAAFLTVAQEPLQLEERAGVKLFVKASPATPPGPFSSKIVVTTDDAAKPRIEIGVRGSGAGGLHAEPAKLVFEPASPGAEIGTVAIVGGKGVKVTGVRASVPTLEPTLAAQPDGSWKVSVKLASSAKPGHVMAKLFVTTADASQPEITVPVLGRVK